MNMKRFHFTLMLILTFSVAYGQYNAGNGFRVSWSLDANEFPTLFPFTGLGAQSVLAGMDFDNDGNREILFNIDETISGGPDPGQLGIYLYESNGNDSFEYVWHFITPDPGNSLPGMTYGDIDNDGLWEIYFSQPPALGFNDDTWGTYIFEQNSNGVFPSSETLLFQYGMSSADNFRPSGYVIDDVDDDGYKELISIDRGARRLSVDAIVSGGLNGSSTFTNEFLDTDNLQGGSIYNVDVVDFDGDGQKEIWVNTWDEFSMAIFEATGTDTYSLEADLDNMIYENDPASFRRHGFAFADVDGDDALECWFPLTNGNLYFLDNVTSSVSDLTAADFVEVGSFGAAVSRGSDLDDIDGDGNYDLIVSRGTEEKIERIEYMGGAPTNPNNYTWNTILESTAEPGDRYYPLDISSVDLDGDGYRREVVLTNLWATGLGLPCILVLEYDPATDLLDDHSLVFAGDDYINIADSDDLDLEGSLSIAAWIKWDSDQDDLYADMIVSKGYASTNNYQFYVAELFEDSFLEFRFYGDNNGWNTWRGPSNFNEHSGQWTHVAITYDEDSGPNMYINGEIVVLDNTMGTNATLVSNDYPLYIGQEYTTVDNSYPFWGNIDEIAIWNAALTAEQVFEHYTGSLEDSTMMAHYEFNEGGGTTAYDFTNSNDGTINGGALYSTLTHPAPYFGPVWHVSTSGSDSVGNGSEENPFAAIQKGIDSSSDGDTVLVAAGTYVENINYNGKNIVVSSLYLTTQDTSYISSTIIDGNWNDQSVVKFENGEDSTSALIGMTITNGYSSEGGGVHCSGSSPRLKYLIINADSAGSYGGGIYLNNSNAQIIETRLENNGTSGYGGGLSMLGGEPELTNVTIISNRALSGRGGGIYCYSSSPTLTNVTITNNSAQSDGGGLCCEGSNLNLDYGIISNNSTSQDGGGIFSSSLQSNSSNLTLTHVMISDNTAWDGGGISFNDSGNLNLAYVTISNNSANDGSGIHCTDDANTSLINSIIWENNPNWLAISGSSQISITYSDIQGGYEGEGNIDTDPLFCEPDSGDYTLSENSPCIGTGEDGADMGAFGLGCGQYNFPPTEFSLSGPANNFYITIDESNMNTGFISFWWSEASDVNGDSLYYLMRATSAEIGDHGIDTNATAIDILYMDIIEDMSDNNVTAAALEWTVYVTDGQDTVEADNAPYTMGIDGANALSAYLEGLLPDEFALHQNYPNPFNPVTTLRYDLPENSFVNVTIYDMLGRQVKTLVNQSQVAGYKSVIWNATNNYGKPVSAGIYLYQIQAGEYISTKKMILLK